MNIRLGRPPTADLPLAAAVTVIAVAGTVAAGAHASEYLAEPRHLDALGYLLVAAAGAGLAWRRDWPTAVLLWAFGCVVTFNSLGYPGGPCYLPLVVAFFTAISRGDRRVAYAVLAVGYLHAVVISPALHASQVSSAAARLGLAAWLLVLAAVAEIVRFRARARHAEAAEAARAAEAQHEQARRRTGEERLRIAQDLHDVLAHQLALITVQANAGLAVLRRDPARTEQSLRAIKDAGNTALAELRTVLDTLRTSDGAAPRRPAPLLSRPADLDRLVQGAHDAGLRVRRETAGEPRPLSGPVSQAGYRIVQEALTNAVRYAGPGAAVALRITYGEGELRIVVDDDGAGTPDPAAPPGGGNGLPGMRERLAVLGGTLEAGPVGHGFRVAATLPTSAPTTTPTTGPPPGPPPGPTAQPSGQPAAQPTAPAAAQAGGPGEDSA